MNIDRLVPAVRRFLVVPFAFAFMAGLSFAAAPRPTAPSTPDARVQATAAPEATAPPEATEPDEANAEARAEREAEREAKGARHGSDSDEFRFGQSVTVNAGEENDRNIVVYGGSVRIDGTHHGEITVFGGHVRIAGTQIGDIVVTGGGLEVSGKVEGSIAVIGGGAHFKKTADVSGDVSLVGGHLDRDPGAVLHGGNVAVTAPSVPSIGFPLGVLGGLSAGLSFLGWLKSTLLTLLVGLLVTALLPTRVEAAAAAFRDRWLACLGVGFAAGVAVIPLMLILLITCVGVVIPPLFYQVAKYFGLTVLFIVVGDSLGRAGFKREMSPFASFFLGLAVLSLIGLIAPVWIVYGWFGVGCALLTRFGTMQPWFKKRTPPVPPLPPTVSAEPVAEPPASLE